MSWLRLALLAIVALLAGCGNSMIQDNAVTGPPAVPTANAAGTAMPPTAPTAQAEPPATETRALATSTVVWTTTSPPIQQLTPSPTAHEELVGLDVPSKREPRMTATRTPVMLPTVAASTSVTVTVRPRAIYRGDSSRPRAALTFDTGQGLPTVIRILDTLKAADIHATFFLMGIWADKNGTVVKRIATEGHELANHSYSHPNFNMLPDDQITAQVLRTEQIIARLTGCTTRPFLRPPLGAANAHTQEVLASAGYYDVMWTAHGGDWLPGATAESVRRTLMRNTGNGSVIVLHSSAPQTAEALPAILADFKTRGLELVTLGELLREDASYNIPPPCTLRTEALE